MTFVNRMLRTLRSGLAFRHWEAARNRQGQVVQRYPIIVDRCAFWGCVLLMCAGFVLPGLGQVGATVLLLRT